MEESCRVQMQFSCDLCCYRGKTKAHLRGHQIVHKEKTFQCSQCNFKARYKYRLAHHNLIHSEERPFVCSHNGCTYSSSRAGNLVAHQLLHSNQKPFKCNLCGKCFRLSSHLNCHIRTHTGEKPYQCLFKDCDYSFTTAGSLQRHFRRHTGEKLYRCSHESCEYSCIEGSNLKRHMKWHETETVSNFNPIKSIEVDEDPSRSVRNLLTRLNKSNNCSDNKSIPPISAVNIEAYSDPEHKTESRPGSSSGAEDEPILHVPTIEVVKGLQVNDSNNDFVGDSLRVEADLTIPTVPNYAEMNTKPQTGPKSKTKACLHTCKICDYEKKNFEKYKLHLQSHREKREFFCPLCDFVGFKRKLLKFHLQTHGIMTHNLSN